jgi:hypothetical protein
MPATTLFIVAVVGLNVADRPPCKMLPFGGVPGVSGVKLGAMVRNAGTGVKLTLYVFIVVGRVASMLATYHAGLTHRRSELPTAENTT